MKKRLFSLFVVFALVVGMLPTVAFATNPETVNVTVTAQQDSTFLQMPTEMTISADLSDEYGFTDEGDAPTALDALIAAHMVVFGDISKDHHMGGYLAVTDGGWVTLAFGSDTTDGFSFAVNNKCANDGVISDYGTYTGYTVNQAVLAEDDVVSFFFYGEGTYWADYYAYFDQFEYEAKVDKDLTVNLEGFAFMFDGCNEIVPTKKIADIDIEAVDEFGNWEETVYATTDADGNATLSFDTTGTYIISARGTTEDAYEFDVPFVCPLATVTVLDADTFTIPDGATLQVSKKGEMHFAPFTEVEPTTETATTVKFDLEEGEYNYRLTQEGKITQTSTFEKTDDEFVYIALTANETDPSTVTEEESNILLNINKGNALSLSPEETHELIAIRTPQAQAEGDSVANYFLEPDFHYDITVLEGENPISIDGNTLTANSEGAAIVTVTYDAMMAFGQLHGALPVENTGVFVVDTDRKIMHTGLSSDSELESVYFTGESTEYTFSTGYADCTASYLNPTITADGVTYGTTFTDATVDGGDSTVILTNGRNIIKVVNGEFTSYYVITARQAGMTMALADGTAITPENPAAPGSEVIVTMTGLSTPVPKLAGLYNSQNAMEYTDGTNTFRSASGYALTDTIKITIPEDYEEETYDLTGAVRLTGFGSPVGDHHDITPAGEAVDMNAPMVNELYGTLPEISIPVAAGSINVKVSVFDGEKFLAKSDSIVTQVQTYPGQALDKGFTDVKLDTDFDGTLDDPYAFATAQEAGEVTYFDAMLAWQIANDGLQNADIAALKAKIDYIQSNYGGVFLNKFNGVATSDLNYMQNGAELQTGVATQYVAADDHLTIAFWKDTDFNNNVIPYYTNGTSAITTLSCVEDTDTTVALEYSYFTEWPATATAPAPVADAQLATVNLETGVLTAIPDAVTDETGAVTLNFEEPGTYTVAPISGEGQDIYPTLLTITVTKKSSGSIGGGGSVAPSNDTVTVQIDGVESTIEEGTAIYGTNKSAFTTWAKETVEVAAGDLVWDAIKTAFAQADLDYTYAGGYISSVEGLSEFDRGSFSGWKYTVNGKYPAVGVDEQTVKAGDVIVLHYTDDFTQEPELEGQNPDGATGPETTVTLGNFIDVKSGDWFYDATAFVVEKGLFEGVSSTEFAPNDNMTRAMMMTVLHRYSGDETVAQTENWAEAGMTWSVQAGISDGTNPEENVTREQLATMLYRFAKATKTEANMSQFTDAAQVSDWAQDAMNWAISTGIIQGNGDNTLNPTGNATRAEVATMMMRFAEWMAK